MQRRRYELVRCGALLTERPFADREIRATLDVDDLAGLVDHDNPAVVDGAEKADAGQDFPEGYENIESCIRGHERGGSSF